MHQDDLPDSERLEHVDLPGHVAVLAELRHLDPEDHGELVVPDDVSSILRGVGNLHPLPVHLGNLAHRANVRADDGEVVGGIDGRRAVVPHPTHPAPYSRPWFCRAIADMRRSPPRYARSICVMWYCWCAPR